MTAQNKFLEIGYKIHCYLSRPADDEFGIILSIWKAISVNSLKFKHQFDIS